MMNTFDFNLLLWGGFALVAMIGLRLFSHREQLKKTRRQLGAAVGVEGPVPAKAHSPNVLSR